MIMRFTTLLALLLNTACATAPAPDVTRVRPDGPLNAPRPPASGALQRALAGVHGPAQLVLEPGHYVLEPVAYTDPSCGNCEDAADTVPASLGVRISGSGVHIHGTHRDSVIIHTRAGYGLLFEDCTDCRLSGVTVTGGVRDADGRATDAALVVRRSTVVVEQCEIRDNIGDSATVARTVVGIAGIAVREQGDVTVRNCRIARNSWDGIALYRGARAHIHDNIVDGVEKAAGARVGGGRGVGIGLTWDARAIVERNLVTRYWKGIGAFVEADADIRENIVEDILTWGIALWGPNGATPEARIERNIVYRTGACGVMIDRPEGATTSTLVGNIIARTGLNERYDSGEPYCWQRAIARPNVPAAFEQRANLLFDNRQPVPAGSAPAPVMQLDDTAFRQRAAPLLRSLAGVAVLQHALALRELR